MVDEGTENLVRERSHWIARAALILLVAILPTGVAQADVPTSQPSGAELALDRTVHRPALLAALRGGPDLVAFGPLFARGSANTELTLSSDLRVREQRSLPATAIGSTPLTRGRLAWIDNSCAQGGYSSCSDVWIQDGGRQSPLGVSRLLLDFHEVQRDSMGTFWALAYPQRLCWERPQWTDLCGPEVTETTTFLDCQVIAFDARGTVRGTWFASDHLPPSELRLAQQPQAFSTDIRDPFHCNSIDLLGAETESFILSMRHTDSVYAVNRASGGVAWKIGGNHWPGHSMRVTGIDGASEAVLDSQHDARVVSPGVLSVFDNGSASGRVARGLVFDIRPGQRTANLRQTFEDPAGRSSACTGSFRRIEASGVDHWLAGWGCSESGATVFSANGEPIVSTALRQDVVADDATRPQAGSNRYSLSYRVTPLAPPSPRR